MCGRVIVGSSIRKKRRPERALPHFKQCPLKALSGPNSATSICVPWQFGHWQWPATMKGASFMASSLVSVLFRLFRGFPSVVVAALNFLVDFVESAVEVLKFFLDIVELSKLGEDIFFIGIVPRACHYDVYHYQDCYDYQQSWYHSFSLIARRFYHGIVRRVACAQCRLSALKICGNVAKKGVRHVKADYPNMPRDFW